MQFDGSDHVLLVAALHSKQSPISNLIIGSITGTFAATVCFPLDTIRRRMQMPGLVYKGQLDAFYQIYTKEGLSGLF